LGAPAVAQKGSLALLQPASSQPVPMSTSVQPAAPPEAPSHRFWDRENDVLFAITAAFSTADFFVTRNNLHIGGQELNPVTHLFAGSTSAWL